MYYLFSVCTVLIDQFFLSMLMCLIFILSVTHFDQIDLAY